MEAFETLEKDAFNNESKNLPNTVLKPIIDANFSTQHINDNDNEIQDENHDTDDDDYDFHQSKLLAQQYAISDDLEQSNDYDKNNENSKFTSALQKVKQRMQEKLQLEQAKKKELEEIHQSRETEKTLLETQVVDQVIDNKDDLDSNNDTNAEKIQNSFISQNESVNDDDEEDEIIRPIRKHKVISEDESHLEKDDFISNNFQNAETVNNMPSADATRKLNALANNNSQDNHGVENDDDDDDADGDDDDDDGLIKRTQRHRPLIKDIRDDDIETNSTLPETQNINQSPNLLSSLFLNDEDDSEDQLPKQDDNLISKIENYESMSKEQRYLARKLERSKIRQAKRTAILNNDHGNDELLNSNKPLKKNRKDVIDEKKLDKIRKEELIRQNELLKKSMEKLVIIKPTKFSKSKLLNNLKKDSASDSDDNSDDSNSQFSNAFSKSPLTSPNSKKIPKKQIISKILSSKALVVNDDNLVSLDSDSDVSIKNEYSDDNDSAYDDDEDADTSTNKKTKMLDVKLFFSKKQKQKLQKTQKSTLSDKIKKLNAKQLKTKLSKNISKDSDKSDILTDEILAKMLFDEQMKNSKSKSKKLKQEQRLQNQQDLLRDGKLTHDDDPEFSEYSSEYDISDEDDGSDDENDDSSDDDAESAKEVNDNNNFKLTNTDAFKDFDFSLSQMYDKKVTQKVDSQLTSIEKFSKMKNNNESINELHTQLADETSFENSRILNPETSFLTKQLKNSDDHHSLSHDNSVHLKELLDSQNLVLETQADSLVITTQPLQESESIPSHEDIIYESTQNETVQMEKTSELVENNNDEDDEDDEDEDEKIKIGRKLKVSEEDSDALQNDSNDFDDSDEDNEEARLKRAELIKLAKKTERKLQKQREKEFKLMGLGEIMEKEAVESEDEYQGTGGVDKDWSDEENSEDEKLIDDASNIKIDENEMRRLQLEKDLKEDQEKVSKTYKDVKTHKLAERRAKDGVYAVDLSDNDDDENEDLLRWREYIRRRKLKERLEFMENNKINISDNDPKKPFFDAMALQIPSHISIYKDSFNNSLSGLNSDESENEGDKERTELKEYYDNNQPSLKRPSLKKRKIKSFENDDDIRFSSFKDQEYERLKNDVLSDNTDDDDIDGSKQLKLLKKKTTVKLNRKLHPTRLQPANKINKADLDNELISGSFSIIASKSNSITASFKRATEKKIKISANTGNVIKEVFVTTSAKAVTNSKASVTRLTSTESVKSDTPGPVVKGSGLDRLDRMLTKSRNRGIKRIGK